LNEKLFKESWLPSSFNFFMEFTGNRKLVIQLFGIINKKLTFYSGQLSCDIIFKNGMPCMN